MHGRTCTSSDGVREALSFNLQSLFVSHSHKEENQLTWSPGSLGMLGEIMEFLHLQVFSKLDLPTIGS